MAKHDRPYNQSQVIVGAAIAFGLALCGSSARADNPATHATADIPRAVTCDESPSDMGCVPGGIFIRGTDDGPRDARPRENIWLQTFYMDRFEVTVESYESCVAAGGCPNTKTKYFDYSRPRQPKVGVSWYDAFQYCDWAGKHLPSEAEWEKAARGSDGRTYPWGDQAATCKRTVIKDQRGRSCGVKKAAGSKPEAGRTFVVGTRDPNPFGLYDMAGNAQEWVADWYSSSYTNCGDACRGFNPRGPCSGDAPCPGHSRKVVRGGSWYWPADHATTFHRRAHVPSNDPYHHFGFRCAASPSEARRFTVGNP